MSNNGFKVIKLDRRHKKYKDGFRYALRFNNGYCRESNACERILDNMYPYDESTYSPSDEWATSWGPFRNRRGFNGLARFYYLNTRSESVITCVLLSLNVDAL